MPCIQAVVGTMFAVKEIGNTHTLYVVTPQTTLQAVPVKATYAGALIAEIGQRREAQPRICQQSIGLGTSITEETSTIRGPE